MTELQNTPTPHIGAKQGEIAETILLPGDPLRAKYIAEHFLTDAKQFNTTRNMYGYTGYYQGKRVSVMGTGMGCPSMGIYSYELIHFYGCKNLIRIGTAGALRPEVKVRELIFAMGSCTTSNYVKQFCLSGDYRTYRNTKYYRHDILNFSFSQTQPPFPAAHSCTRRNNPPTGGTVLHSWIWCKC